MYHIINAEWFEIRQVNLLSADFQDLKTYRPQ